MLTSEISEVKKKRKKKSYKMGYSADTLSYKHKVRDIYEDKEITPSQLRQLEDYVDKLWSKLGMDIEFTKHFKDRVNDPRNQKPITMAELVRIFKQQFKKWGKKIAALGPEAQAILKDMRTDVNIPFVLDWDAKDEELNLVAKTIMRKKNFKSSGPEFAVEAEQKYYHGSYD